MASSRTGKSDGAGLGSLENKSARRTTSSIMYSGYQTNKLIAGLRSALMERLQS